ncbi:portal protein [Maribacter phage Panino]
MNNMNDLAKEMFSSNGFPDPLGTNKDSNSFGLQVGKSIENEWFRKHKSSDCRFYDNQGKYHRNRLYARAEQPVGKYKDEMAVDGDLSFLNLDWTPVPILPKFVDIVVNGQANRLFSIKAQAIDKVATDKKSKYVLEMEKDMAAKEMLMQAKQQLNVDGFVNDPKELPETSEELQVHMQLNYKEGIEIAEEEAIKYIFKKNDFLETKSRFDYDVTVLGIGAMKHTFNTSDGVKIEYVDPANLVYSYTESPYMEDCYYFGEVKQIPLSELRKINPDLTVEELTKAKDSASSWDLYHRNVNKSPSEFDGHTCNVLFFNYKVTREVVYKKKTTANGGVSLIKKTEDWNPDPSDMELRGYERMSKFEDVWYEGVLVLGTNMLLKWSIAENMLRDNSSNEVLPNYIVVAPRVYDGRSESLLGRMIPFADQIQIVSLKLQQVASRVVPDGVFIDVDGLNEIDLGDGLKYDPKRALQFFFQTGSVVGRSQTGLGEFNHGKIPIQELNGSSGRSKIQALIELYNTYLQMIRDVTGLNEARDASTPDSKTLVGVQQLAALNSNTATRHIQEAGIYATRKIAEACSYRVADILKYSDSRDELVQAIGAANVSILGEIDALPLHYFGIFIEVEPDAQERNYLEQNIQQALQQKLIYLDDAAEIREIKNVKLANQVMKIRRLQKTKIEQQNSLENLRVQSEEQTKTAQAKSQGKIAEIEAEAAAKMKVDTNLKNLEDRNEEKNVERKEYLMGVEFDLEAYLKGIDANHKDVLSENENKRKSLLQKQASSQQSAIEGQKAETGSNAPLNFESENDNLSKTDFAQFEPK